MVKPVSQDEVYVTRRLVPGQPVENIFWPKGKTKKSVATTNNVCVGMFGIRSSVVH